jgi:hypothetical protein
MRIAWPLDLGSLFSCRCSTKQNQQETEKRPFASLGGSPPQMMAKFATQAPFASASRRPSFATSTTLVLERPCRSQRGGEQGRAE